MRSYIRFIFFFTIFAAFVLIFYYCQRVEYDITGISVEPYVSVNYAEKEINKNAVEKGFVVKSPACNIPRTDLYHDSIRKFIYEWKPISCSDREPLTEVTYEVGTHTLKVIRNRTQQYEVEMEDLNCCYSVINRPHLGSMQNKDDDDRHEYSSFCCFKESAILSPETEFIYVRCNSKRKRTLLYETMHAMVAAKPTKISFSTNEYSVLLIGIDSISRQNLLRTMPKTVQFVEENGWLPLEGYTKVGDNTFPNLITVLTGLTVEELQKACWEESMSKLDNCPFIWKDYKLKNYITAYVEDMPEYGTFNFEKYGFLDSPTDYYTRPLMVAGKEKLKIKKDGGVNYCMGPIPQAEYLLQYVTEFAQRFQDRRYFHLFWTNTFSHDELNQPSVMDSRYRAFLRDLNDYLNSTIVVFFSDHGMRFGEIRETYVGWLEERMPFLYIGLPESFRVSYPEKYANLVNNRNRLVSPFDLHLTLQEILHGNVVRVPEACPKCGSLLGQIPWNRSCPDAAIQWHWCTCSSDFDSVSANDHLVVKTARFVVSRMNAFLRSTTGQVMDGYRCATLGLKKIIAARRKAGFLFGEPKQVVVFETNPSGAIFEATVHGSWTFQLESSVSRINAYGNQSSCVLSNAILRKYCFCV